MARLNTKVLREALDDQELVIEVDGEERLYPVPPLSVLAVLRLQEAIGALKWTDPAELEAFLADLAGLTGLPPEVLETRTAGEIMGIVSFLFRCQMSIPEGVMERAMANGTAEMAGVSAN